MCLKKNYSYYIYLLLWIIVIIYIIYIYSIFGYYILKVCQRKEMRKRQVWGRKMRKNENEYIYIIKKDKNRSEISFQRGKLL